MVEFGEWLCSHVLKNDPHRQVVFRIPKILRWDFLYDRDLLSDLSRGAWDSLKLFLRETVAERNPIPGAVIAIQTFGDFHGFNPHCHVLVTDGCFYGTGEIRLWTLAPGGRLFWGGVLGDVPQNIKIISLAPLVLMVLINVPLDNRRPLNSSRPFPSLIIPEMPRLFLGM